MMGRSKLRPSRASALPVEWLAQLTPIKLTKGKIWYNMAISFEMEQ